MKRGGDMGPSPETNEHATQPENQAPLTFSKPQEILDYVEGKYHDYSHMYATHLILLIGLSERHCLIDLTYPTHQPQDILGVPALELSITLLEKLARAGQKLDIAPHSGEAYSMVYDFYLSKSKATKEEFLEDLKTIIEIKQKILCGERLDRKKFVGRFGRFLRDRADDLFEKRLKHSRTQPGQHLQDEHIPEIWDAFWQSDEYWQSRHEQTNTNTLISNDRRRRFGHLGLSGVARRQVGLDVSSRKQDLN